MIDRDTSLVAIVDYGLGNLFSIQRACERASLEATVSSDARTILSADAIVLPGIGAFGDAMDALRRLDLVQPLREAAASEKVLMGVCLGMQLLMTESHEFGHHRGLGVIDGEVVGFRETFTGSHRVKVPHVGWNAIRRTRGAPGTDPWTDSLLDGVADNENMYFVHSFYVVPAAADATLSVSSYGGIEFCSSVRRGNVFGCQFHPERSGERGLRVYRNLATRLRMAGTFLGNRQ